ncbi:MAG: flippase-like domain-containing protein [Candidatus Omnitrophica bacterium]|nr:flippase-like domain-containing protein [Candidatus Omnitrophota bacterium]
MTTFKKIASILLRVGISIILLVILFKFNKININDLVNDIKGTNKLLLIIGFVIFFLSYILGFLRWRMLLKAASICIPLKKLISSFSGGVFFNVFLPSTIGGDIVRSADLAEHTQKAKTVIATVFLDRLSGYIGLVVIISIAILLKKDLVHDNVVFSSVIVILALLVIVLLVLFNNRIYSVITKFLSTPGAGKIKETIKDLHQEIHIFRNHKKVIIYNLALSILIQVIQPLSIYFIACSLGLKVNFIYFLIFLPIIGAITLIPISIGGLGLREGLFVVYFAKVGVIKQLALAMSFLSGSFVLIYASIGGLIYVLTVHHRLLQHNKPSAV